MPIIDKIGNVTSTRKLPDLSNTCQDHLMFKYVALNYNLEIFKYFEFVRMRDSITATYYNNLLGKHKIEKAFKST